MAEAAVSFRDISRVYGGGDQQIVALDSITFDVPAGSIYGVVGTSGAGKSTLLRTANGLETPSSGEVSVLGRQPAELSDAHLRELRREVGMIFQHYNLLNSRTVADNVAMPLVLAKTPREEINRRVTEALERVGLADRANHRPRQLSGGQRQRVGIARSLVTNPKVLLCDEPTSALDPLTTSQILDLLTDINEDLGLTIVIITHQMDVVARIADYVAVLEQGRLIENGPVEQIFAQPQAALTRRFIETVVPQRLPEPVVDELRRARPDTLVRVVHTGGAARTLIPDLQRLGVTVNLYQASDAPLRRTTVGTMVLGLDGQRTLIDEALAHIADTEGLNAEVLP
ncbi:methionine ABC transporter ATP-binding protein [Corynebacterium pilosum]|uniref:ABC transporter n=1 Tax=Corynebacterium pilosum TaxID=35756 RepID=A0A376CK93_9CORY|nr:ATP-binding cassette domain-containing protein [Corynebacterium pilosum]STC68735.1 ABC transporter [Corynebacterium pilosum]